MSEHSRLYSPSGSHTWIPCTASAERNADKPRKDSVHSLRGTMLHEFCEKNFHLRDPELVDFSPIIAANKDKKKGAEDAEQALIALNAAWGLEDLIDDRDMTKLEFNGNIVGMEECFGTLDLLMYSRLTKKLLIGDYKFGYNAVDPAMNPQLLIYALIAVAELEKQGHEVEDITLAVIQPRESMYPATFDLHKNDLGVWEAGVLKPAYVAIETGLVEFSAGESQCEWCKSKFGCPELEGTMMEVIPKNQMNLLDLLTPEVIDPEVLEDETTLPVLHEGPSLAARLQAVPMLRMLAAAIEEEAMRLMTEGVQVEGFKLVRGRTKRKWKDEEQAEKWLAARKFKEKERCSFKVISPTQAEKLIKGMELTPKLANAFRAMIESPLGELTYAPADDKRPGVEITPPNLLELLPPGPAFDDDIAAL